MFGHSLKDFLVRDIHTFQKHFAVNDHRHRKHIDAPLPAFFCWYARGRGWPAAILSGLIVGAILSQTVLLLQGVRIAHVPELIVLALALIVFRRKPKEFAVMTAAALVTAVAVQALLPVWG